MRIIAIGLIFSLLGVNANQALAQQNDMSADLSTIAQSAKVEATMWRNVAEAIPLGSKVKLQTVENKRISGTLMRVDGTSVMVKKNTRRPEPAITVDFDNIAKIERDHGGGGINIAKAAAIGLATGAGVVVSLILFAMQFD
jgi:hypothetical protein